MPILVYLQHYGDCLHQVSLEIASKGIELAKNHKREVHGVFVGKVTEEIKQQFGYTGLSTIYVCEVEKNTFLDTSVLAIQYCIDQISPSIVLVGGTLEGRAIAPQVAAHYRTGVTADCTELQINNEGLLIQTRPAFGGDVMAEIITPIARPQMATVRQGIFKIIKNQQIKPNIKYIPNDFPPSQIEVVQEDDIQQEHIGEGEKVIAVGGGIKSLEQLEKIKSYCQQQHIPLMCSRAIVERGWLSQKHQIGLSGRSIQSKILITLGISGSVQFMAGVQQVEYIIAMNHAYKAPIMYQADKAICVDINEVINKLNSK